MHRFLGSLFILSLSSTILAADDPNYNPAENFRPHNITGLNSLYAWVGSYYNATMEMAVTPQIFYNDINPLDLCPPLQNHTSTLKLNSILAILDRGLYNNGTNPVDIWLAVFPPNFNMSTVPYEDRMLNEPPFWWVLQSTTPAWNPDASLIFPTNYDYFDFTSTKVQNSFSLDGVVNTNGQAVTASWTNNNIWMPTCNSSYYYGNWSFQLVQECELPGFPHWANYKVPIMNITFDNQAANLTLDGSFVASPYLRTNDTNYEGGHYHYGQVGTQVLGTARLNFKGVLDTYHSDVLDLNASSPSWLRTVGFGNNSLNIVSGVDQLRPIGGGLGAVTFVIACATLFAAFF